MAVIFGLDFGTTNTLVSYITGLEEVIHFTDRDRRTPHPSIVLYKGSTVVVGHEAKLQANKDEYDANSRNFVPSPKTLLGSVNTIPPVIGREDITRVMVVSEVLKYLKKDCDSRKTDVEEKVNLDEAVFTIPVSFNGKAREDLRQAANIAGIKVCYFIHEPLAALYGYIRQQNDYQRVLQSYHGKYVLVFDWGGGTLDLTLCQIISGTFHQIKSEGNVDVGGDKFDEILESLVIEKYGISNNVNAVRRKIDHDVSIKLMQACETAKIALSNEDEADIYIRNFLNISDIKDKSLDVVITREEFENASSRLVQKGITLIERILNVSGIKREEVALCLPTGGMINIPLIKNQLEEMFPGRVDYADYGDRIISEGAAWAAYDKVIPVLSKPIELKLASKDKDNNFIVLAPKGKPLPIGNKSLPIHHSQFYVTDTSDGLVNLQFQSPIGIGRQGPNASRNMLGLVPLEIDRDQRPLIERINIDLLIDANYVIHVKAFSTGIEKEAILEIYDIEFSLELFRDKEDDGMSEVEETDQNSNNGQKGIAVRSLIIDRNDKKFIAGDIVEKFYPNFMSRQTGEATEKQIQEKVYYLPCSICGFKIQKCTCQGQETSSY